MTLAGAIQSVLDQTYKDFKLLCEQAVENRFCSVCVPPFMVESCKKALSGTQVKVCTVVGFPLGYNSYIGKIGYNVYYTSSKVNNGIDILKPLFENKISVLSGQTGAGKSSLLNAIDPNYKQETNEISKAAGTTI